jgi:hypothetical protein
MYNAVYYWLHHMPYHSPHRIQVIFHSMVYVGVPGLYMFFKSLWNSDVVVAVPRRGALLNGDTVEAIAKALLETRQPAVVHHYHHQDTSSVRQRQQQRREEKKREDDLNSDADSEEEEEKKEEKKTPVAQHSEKSTAVWMVLIGGVVSSFYHSYHWAYGHCRRWSSRAQMLVENVGG